MIRGTSGTAARRRSKVSRPRLSGRLRSSRTASNSRVASRYKPSERRGATVRWASNRASALSSAWSNRASPGLSSRTRTSTRSRAVPKGLSWFMAADCRAVESTPLSIVANAVTFLKYLREGAAQQRSTARLGGLPICPTTARGRGRRLGSLPQNDRPRRHAVLDFDLLGGLPPTHLDHDGVYPQRQRDLRRCDLIDAFAVNRNRRALRNAGQHQGA